MLQVEERCALLQSTRVFASIPSGELGILAEMMLPEAIDAGEYLFRQGDAGDAVYVLARGRLEVLLGAHEERVRELMHGDVLGEYAMFTGLRRTATVRALERSELLGLDFQRFQAFLMQFPGSSLELLRNAVVRLQALENRLYRKASPDR